MRTVWSLLTALPLILEAAVLFLSVPVCRDHEDSVEPPACFSPGSRGRCSFQQPQPNRGEVRSRHLHHGSHPRHMEITQGCTAYITVHCKFFVNNL